MSSYVTDTEGTTWKDPAELEIAKPRAVIKGWTRQPMWDGEEVYGERLVGRVRNHPNFPADTIVYTSRIVRDIDENTVETNNTIYTLA